MASYSAKEDEYIKKFFELFSDSQIATRLNRTHSGIKKRRIRLGILRPAPGDIDERRNIKFSKRAEIIGLYHLIETGKMVEVAKRRLFDITQGSSDQPFIKRKRNKVAMIIKARAFEKVCSGLPVNVVASKLGFPKKTVYEWRNQFQPYKGDTPVTITIQSKI